MALAGVARHRTFSKFTNSSNSPKSWLGTCRGVQSQVGWQDDRLGEQHSSYSFMQLVFFNSLHMHAAHIWQLASACANPAAPALTEASALSQRP